MQPLMQWQDYAHPYIEHTLDWYWILGIVSVAGAILSFFFGSVIFGILILVSGFTLGIMSHKKPEIVDISVTTSGIVIGDFEYSYSKFHSFWIETDHMYGPRILLHPESNVMHLVSIMIGEGVDLDHLADILNDYMEEAPMRESAIHKLFDYFGF